MELVTIKNNRGHAIVFQAYFYDGFIPWKMEGLQQHFPIQSMKAGFAFMHNIMKWIWFHFLHFIL